MFNPSDRVLISGPCCLTYLGLSELGKESVARNPRKAHEDRVNDFFDFVFSCDSVSYEDNGALIAHRAGCARCHPEYGLIGCLL